LELRSGAHVGAEPAVGGYLDDKPEETKVLNRRLIYVGMTRATNELVLTASGNHPYIADLEA
jgi:superfamily I DNA/RNA helicase